MMLAGTRALVGCLVLFISAVWAQAGPIYLALGDSSAFGETNRTRNPSNGDRGYVKAFADYLGRGENGVRPDVINLAIDGETSSSFRTGTGRVSADGQGFNTNYNGLPVPYAQSKRLNDVLGNAADAARVEHVTVQLGANNLDAVASQADFLTISDDERQTRIRTAFMQVAADYVSILGDVRTRFPDAAVYVMGYHNPYNGEPGHPFYALADPAVKALNELIWGVGTAAGAKYVDVYGAVHPNEASLTLVSTWQTDPVNYVHLNDRGYDAAAAKLIETAGGPVTTPEPGTLILAGVGGLIVAVGRRVRGRRA